MTDEFISTIVADPILENTWLSSLALMENLAAQNIERSIGKSTPIGEVDQILAHAGDERRHAQLIIQTRTIPHFTVARDRALENRFHSITESFVLGYFGNDLLQGAKSRHAAYVHGALTIEQFPFQVYTRYIEQTKIAEVLKIFPLIIADEYGHLNLGRYLQQTLEADEKLSVLALIQIEKDMTKLYIERLHRVALEYVSQSNCAGSDNRASRCGTLPSFESRLAESEESYVAWASALSFAGQESARHLTLANQTQPHLSLTEQTLDETKWARLIRRSVLLKRRKLWSSSASYREIEARYLNQMNLYLTQLSALPVSCKCNLNYNGHCNCDARLPYVYRLAALEIRALLHYKHFAQAVDDVGVSHTLNQIIRNRSHCTSEHSAFAHSLSGYSPESQKQLIDGEAKLFVQLEINVFAMSHAAPDVERIAQ